MVMEGLGGLEEAEMFLLEGAWEFLEGGELVGVREDVIGEGV